MSTRWFGCESNGGKIELEGLKLGFHHMNDLLNLLNEPEEIEADTRSLLEAAEAGETDHATARSRTTVEGGVPG